jgi:hypothetical protein
MAQVHTNVEMLKTLLGYGAPAGGETADGPRRSLRVTVGGAGSNANDVPQARPARARRASTSR